MTEEISKAGLKDFPITPEAFEKVQENARALIRAVARGLVVSQVAKLTPESVDSALSYSKKFPAMLRKDSARAWAALEK